MSTSAVSKTVPVLPLKDYFASLGYLTLLLTTSIVLLPRSTSYFFPPASSAVPIQHTSADRPEHPWLTPLTSNPTSTIAWEVAGVAVCSAWWSAKVARWWGLTNPTRVRDTILVTLGTALIISFILILFGAPSTTHVVSTCLLALHLALLTAAPVAAALGVPSMYDAGILARYRLTRLLCEFSPETPAERALVYPFVGTMLGAWIGAIPIPLDWDRPWQSWPLTPALGSVLGFVIAGYASFAHSAFDSFWLEIQQDRAATATAEATAARGKASGKKRKGAKGKTA